MPQSSEWLVVGVGFLTIFPVLALIWLNSFARKMSRERRRFGAVRRSGESASNPTETFKLRLPDGPDDPFVHLELYGQSWDVRLPYRPSDAQLTIRSEGGAVVHLAREDNDKLIVLCVVELGSPDADLRAFRVTREGHEQLAGLGPFSWLGFRGFSQGPDTR